MYRTIIYFIITQFLINSLFGQISESKLNLKKGQEIIVELEVVNNRFQTAGAQVINFKLAGSAVHKFTVTDIATNLIKIHHEMQSMKFDFEGMGQKQSFDSNIEEDLKGPFGPFIKDLLLKKNDFEVDSFGNTSSFTTNTIPIAKPDDKLVTITDMLKPLLKLNNTPQLGPGFFSVFRGSPLTPGLTYKTDINSGDGLLHSTYILKELTDSTIVADITITGNCNSALEMMGHITRTSETKVGTGKIIYDRKTGLIKQKTETIDSKGTTEAMGGTVPINGKISITILVNPGK
jgi:hypothetical protein